MWNHTHPNRLFRNHILAHKGCWAPKFLHAPRNDQVLLVHPPLGTGVLLTFFQRVVQNWLKIQCIRRKIFGARGSSLMKFYHVTCRSAWIITRGQVLGGHRTLKILEGKKRPKFSTFYNNFQLWLRISLDWIEISTSGKRRCHPQFLPHWIKKFGEFWSTNTWDHVANVYLT